MSHGASAFATGVHLVLMAWISIVELGLSSSQLGWIQAAVLFPNLLLILVAGAWADRVNPAKVMSAAQLLLSCSFVSLLLLLTGGYANFVSLLIYAITVGIGQAFIQPVREKLVTQIQGSSAQKRISLLSITQFSLQSCGMALAALTDTVGLNGILVIQIVASLSSCIVLASLVKFIGDGTANTTSGHKTAQDIAGAARYVINSSGLCQLMALITFNGYMHMGVFLVAIPVVATGTYRLSSSEYAWLQMLFVLGMICAHTFLLRAKLVEYPGQGALFSLLYTTLIGFALAKGPTPFGFYSLVFLWGLTAGNSAGRCRLVLQSLVVPEMKGRIMAVYQLMLFGAAPFGALVTGYLINYMSIKNIFSFMSMSSAALFVVFLFSRTLWSIKQHVEKGDASSS